MKEVFDFILTSTIYGSIVGVLILLFKNLVKDKISTTGHYLIWMILIVKLLVPIGPESIVSVFNIFPDGTIERKIESKDIFTSDHKEVRYEEKEELKNETYKPKSIEGEEYNIGVKEFISYIWIIGVLIIGSWIFISNWILYNKLKGAREIIDQRVVNIFNRCKTQLGIKDQISIITQDVIPSPSIIGITKPRILLTTEILNLKDKDIEYILLHELAHLKRKDIWVNYFLTLIQVFHWFNPIIAYLFNKIREDIEVDTDAKVINLFSNEEYKEYGRTLLNVIEQVNNVKYMPKVLGMVDDKKGIKRRIQVITKSEFYKKNKVALSAIGLVCIIALSSILLTSGISKKDNMPREIQDKAKVLVKYKTPYVGDNSKVIGIIDNLTYSQWRKDVELLTEKEPYGIVINYDFQSMSISEATLKSFLRSDTILMFALIDNIEKITCKINNVNTEGLFTEFIFTRKEVQNDFNIDLREYGKTKESIEILLDNLLFNVELYPEKYSLAMSSSPGIKIYVKGNYDEKWQKTFYKTEEGSFLTWNAETGQLKSVGSQIELEHRGYSLYWSPYSEDNKVADKEENLITIGLLDEKGQMFREKKIKIYNENGLYSVNKKDSNNRDKIEVYRKDIETEEEEQLFIIDDDERVKNIKAIISNSKKSSKTNNINSWDYRFNIYDKEKGEIITVEINLDNKTIRYGDDLNSNYYISDDDVSTIRSIMRIEYENNNVVEYELWEGRVIGIDKNNSNDERLTVSFKTEFSSSTMAMKSEDISKYNIKVGDYIKVYAECGPEWFEIRKVEKVTETRNDNGTDGVKIYK